MNFYVLKMHLILTSLDFCDNNSLTISKGPFVTVLHQIQILVKQINFEKDQIIYKEIIQIPMQTHHNLVEIQIQTKVMHGIDQEKKINIFL